MEPGTVVRAIFDFRPSVSEELPLFTGDVIEVLGVVDEFWLLGNKDGVTGQFPITFVEVVTIPSTGPRDKLYVCISDYGTTASGTLPLKRASNLLALRGLVSGIRGDVVVSEGGVDGSWLCGRNAWGSRGIFPLSCVTELHLSVRSRELCERVAAASELPGYALGQARALMGLSAQLEEELDFREGDIITIVGVPEPGWLEGELEGRRGVFPEGFVELLAPLRTMGESLEVQHYDTYTELEEEEEEEDGEEDPATEVEDRVQLEDGLYGIALYDFRALEPGELDFDVGDRILVLSTLEDGWLEGELRGRRGVFPHRFVRLEDQHRHGDAPQPGEDGTASGDKAEGAYSPQPDSDHSQVDLTVWDLDFLERRMDHRSADQTHQGGLSVSSSKPHGSDHSILTGGSPTRDTTSTQSIPAHRAVQRTGSGSPTPPKPPRPSLPPLLAHREPLRKLGNGEIPPSPAVRTRNQMVRHHNWAHENSSVGKERSGDSRSSGTTAAALTGWPEERKHRMLFRHASTTDADLVQSSGTRGRNGLGDLDTKLSQQLAEFERSLPGHKPHDLARVSRHFSILDYSSESDIIRGSTHLPSILLSEVPAASSSCPSSLERRKVLRPPPPRPRILRGSQGCLPHTEQHQGHPPPFRPARRAPRPPQPCPRRSADRISQALPSEDEETPVEVNETLEKEEEQLALLLRLQEVERDLEMYNHSAEELRAVLEEEQDEVARQQALENLDLCTFNIDTLSLEQQQLQGEYGQELKPCETFCGFSYSPGKCESC